MVKGGLRQVIHASTIASLISSCNLFVRVCTTLTLLKLVRRSKTLVNHEIRPSLVNWNANTAGEVPNKGQEPALRWFCSLTTVSSQQSLWNGSTEQNSHAVMSFLAPTLAFSARFTSASATVRCNMPLNRDFLHYALVGARESSKPSNLTEDYRTQ
jgi:hypothetical protein